MNKQQLANKIWASANKMRSKIEASEYKDYILGLIFYKFLSDNEVGYLVKNGVWRIISSSISRKTTATITAKRSSAYAKMVWATSLSTEISLAHGSSPAATSACRI